MENSTKFYQALGNIQIVSALTWATTILVCSWAVDQNTISSILIATAGLHVILLAQYQKKAEHSTGSKAC